tara:strand:- start:152 stop:481 length:330 start_codon:yes stop_codon:yes gene_type:complete
MKLIKNTLDNCVLSNVVQRNSDNSDDHEVKYLKSLKSIDQQTVSEYFTRSTEIINKMRELGVDSNETWDSVDQSHVKSIMTLIQQQNFNAVIPSIRQLLSTLESQYGVV